MTNSVHLCTTLVGRVVSIFMEKCQRVYYPSDLKTKQSNRCMQLQQAHRWVDLVARSTSSKWVNTRELLFTLSESFAIEAEILSCIFQFRKCIKGGIYLNHSRKKVFRNKLPKFSIRLKERGNMWRRFDQTRGGKERERERERGRDGEREGEGEGERGRMNAKETCCTVVKKFITIRDWKSGL